MQMGDLPVSKGCFRGQAGEDIRRVRTGARFAAQPRHLLGLYVEIALPAASSKQLQHCLYCFGNHGSNIRRQLVRKFEGWACFDADHQDLFRQV
jgi:hypothetical protein